MSSAQREHLVARLAASWRGRRRAGRCGRSSRRRAGRRRTSPRETSLGRAYGVRKVTEPSVWPGVWSTTNRSPASSSSLRRRRARATSSGSANVVVAAEQHLRRSRGRSRPSGRSAGAGRRGGSRRWRRRCRRPGRRDHMWSTWPWVTSTRDRLEPVLADDLGDAGGGVLAGVDDHALGAGAGRDDVAVGRPTDLRGSRRSAPRQTSGVDRVRPVVCWSVGSLPRAVRAMTTMGDRELRQAVPRRSSAG